jgi:hypothetical protein
MSDENNDYCPNCHKRLAFGVGIPHRFCFHCGWYVTPLSLTPREITMHSRQLRTFQHFPQHSPPCYLAK